jgi:hypothetical protein
MRIEKRLCGHTRQDEARGLHSPSPGTPGEGRGEGLQRRTPKALTLTLSRSTGRGNRGNRGNNRVYAIAADGAHGLASKL